MAIKECQLNIRLTPATDQWLEQVAGGKEKKADYVRRLLEDDMRRRQEDVELAMFNRAAEDLAEEDYNERESLLGAFSNRDAT